MFKLIQTDASKVDRPESLLDSPFQFSLAIMRTNMHTFPQFLPPIIAHQIQSAVEPTPRVPVPAKRKSVGQCDVLARGAHRKRSQNFLGRKIFSRKKILNPERIPYRSGEIRICHTSRSFHKDGIF